MSEKDAFFNPLSTHVEQEKAINILNKSLKNANDGELFFEHRIDEGLIYDDGNLKNSSHNISEGFGLRAVNDEHVSYAHSSTISEEELEKASKIVKTFNKKNNNISNSFKFNTNNLYQKGNTINNSFFNSKIELLKEIDDYARTLDKIVKQATISLNSSVQEVGILRHDHIFMQDTRPMSRINVSLIVEHNGKRESASSGSGGRYDIIDLMDSKIWKKHVNEALRIAKLNLNAIEAPAGIMDVVLGPGWPGVLLHEAVGHGLEGDPASGR